MLAGLPPLGNLNGTQQSAEMEAFSVISDDEFPDFSSGNLLENIDFDNLFSDSDVLSDLEMDPNLLAALSLSSGDEYYSDINTSTTTASVDKTTENSGGQSFGMDSIESGLMYGMDTCCVTSKIDQEMVRKSDSDLEKTSKEELTSSLKKVVNNNRHSKAHRSNNKPLGVSSKGTCKEGLQGKRKVKVNWTPELHGRFVQAVEQLGVDKAVPSRILEVMGIDCLTRHNIASHLQKYRSRRKHLLAREAKAVIWSQRRHAYAPVTAGAVLGKRERGSPWLMPSLGLPPVARPPQHVVHGPSHNNRPFHVWGHPSVDQSLRPVLPKLLPHSLSTQPPPIWPSLAHRDSSLPYWHSPQIVSQHIRNGLCQGVSCLPPTLGTTQRVPVPPVQRFPHHAMYKVEPNGHAVSVGQSRANLFLDLHPSKESVDAAIGDVLSKPWLPLPIGLKPPELDSVMEELERNGVSNIPPASA